MASNETLAFRSTLGLVQRLHRLAVEVKQSWDSHLNAVGAHNAAEATLVPITPDMPLQEALVKIGCRADHLNFRIRALRAEHPLFEFEWDVNVAAMLRAYLPNPRDTENTLWRRRTALARIDEQIYAACCTSRWHENHLAVTLDKTVAVMADWIGGATCEAHADFNRLSREAARILERLAGEPTLDAVWLQPDRERLRRAIETSLQERSGAAEGIIRFERLAPQISLIAAQLGLMID